MLSYAREVDILPLNDQLNVAPPLFAYFYFSKLGSAIGTNEARLDP